MTVLELYQQGKTVFDLMDRKNLSLKGYYGYVPLVNEMKRRLIIWGRYLFLTAT